MARNGSQNGHAARPVGAKELEGVKRSEVYRKNALVRRLVETIEGAWTREGTRETRLQETEARNEQLSMTVEKARVLVVLYADGSARVFSDDKLDMRVVNFPNSDSVHAERYFRTTLPYRYRELFETQFLREDGTNKLCMTPAEMLDLLEYRRAIRKMEATCERVRLAQASEWWAQKYQDWHGSRS